MCFYQPATNSIIASQVVLIREGITVNADIILEQSIDQMNWTAALPGSDAPSTPKRFFAVRLMSH